METVFNFTLLRPAEPKDPELKPPEADDNQDDNPEEVEGEGQNPQRTPKPEPVNFTKEGRPPEKETAASLATFLKDEQLLDSPIDALENRLKVYSKIKPFTISEPPENPGDVEINPEEFEHDIRWLENIIVACKAFARDNRLRSTGSWAVDVRKRYGALADQVRKNEALTPQVIDKSSKFVVRRDQLPTLGHYDIKDNLSRAKTQGYRKKFFDAL